MSRLITIETQVYEITGETLPHTTKDGRQTTLHQTRTHCARCGGIFEFWVLDDTLQHSSVNRRCQAHKNPGIKVRKHRLGSPADQEVWFSLGK